MTEPVPASRSVIMEREFAHPPENVWRALTEGPLLEHWLMKTDFAPIVDRAFTFTADWGVVEGRVLTVEPNRSLSYTWAAYGLESIVTWTLTPTNTGTHVRMEQSGFRPDQEQAYQGAQYGWQQFIAALETVVAGL